MYKVACVVPVYNVDEFLPACLDSLVNQTLGESDLQVIIVDDGSTDDSPGIADAYVAEHPNFQVHHIENGGLGHARNYGVRYADAEYVCFADSDDIIVEDAYEKMYELGKRTDSDIILGDVVRFNSKKTWASALHRRAFTDAVEIMHITTHPQLINDTTSWNKLFKKSFYDEKKLFWPEGIIYEDIPVTIPAHYMADHVAYLDQVVYKWRVRDSVSGGDSLTQQRTALQNIIDRLRVMKMVDDFFDENGLDEQQHLVKDTKWLSVDLMLFVDKYDVGDDEYKQLMMQLVGDRLKTIDKRAFDGIYALDRIKYQCVIDGDGEHLSEVRRFQKRGVKSMPVYRSGDRWYGKFPFDWCDKSLMDMTYDLKSARKLKQQIRHVVFNEDGLVIRGSAYNNYLNVMTKSDVSFKLSLVDDQIAPVVDFETALVKANHGLRVDLSRDYKRITPRINRYKSYRSNITDDVLFSLPNGKYRVRLSYSADGVECEPCFVKSPVKGANPRPCTIEHDGRRYSVSYGTGYELVLEITDVINEATDVICENGSVIVKHDGIDEALPLDVDDNGEIITGRWQSTEFDYFDTIPRFIEFDDERILMFHATRSGKLAVQLLVKGGIATSYEFVNDSVVTVSIDGRYIDNLDVADGKVVGFSYGVEIPVSVRKSDNQNYIVTLDLHNDAVNMMRADTYRIVLHGTDSDGMAHDIDVYGGVTKEKPRTKSVLVNGYRYGFDSKYARLMLHVWYQKPWIDRTKRRRRIAQIFVYPIARKLPIKSKMLMLESKWGKSIDCNPYGFYEWMQENHPEYECVWSVNDLRMPLDGNGRKVVRGSLDYFLAIARAKFLVNNVNFLDAYRKRPEQIEIQTMHGTPLKTLGLDVPGEMDTPEKVEKFLARCDRWDYLVVQGKRCEEITKSCYRYRKAYLETGYPRNDRLFRDNTPEKIAELKSKYGLDVNKKLVTYAPTWRVKNHFDLELDMANMCDVLGDEYQFGLRLHYFSTPGFDSTTLDNRIVDLSYVPDMSDVFLMSDIIITDYSSLMFDYAVLPERRPMLFYPYDLEDYRDNLRGFNIDLETEAPGPLLFTTDEVIDAIKNIDQVRIDNKERYDRFVSNFVEFEHGTASEQIYHQVFEKA